MNVDCDGMWNENASYFFSDLFEHVSVSND